MSQPKHVLLEIVHDSLNRLSEPFLNNVSAELWYAIIILADIKPREIKADILGVLMPLQFPT